MMTEHYDQREDLYKAQKDVSSGIEAYIAENANTDKRVSDDAFFEYKRMRELRGRLLLEIADKKIIYDLVEKRLSEFMKKKTPD